MIEDKDLIGRQIPLTFNKYDQMDFALYVAGPNQQALQYLQNICSDPERKNVYLWGQTGTGKSHLLQALCTSASDAKLSIAYIPLADANLLSPRMLEGLQHQSLVCIDDIESIAGTVEWEQAIFHLFNQLREVGIPLIMSARHSPKGSPICLPDLKSRLGWDHVFHLKSADEKTALLALQRRAQGRGFALPDEVADYLIKRVARDMHSLFELLDRLDKASLVAKKKLTIPFVKTLLD